MIRLIIIVLTLCSVAVADRDGGPYLGFGYGMSQFGKNDVYTNLKEDRANSYSIYAGAAINKHLAVELARTSLGAYKLENSDELKATIISLATVAQYPFYKDMFSVYAKAGVGHIKLNTLADTGFTFLLGGGVSYRYNEYLGVKIGYEYYPFDYEDADEASHSMKIEYVYGAIEVQF
ncbi:MAG: porin family protein [Sulfurimonadaceae bacterium]|jgi:opacity protein-like surface antigen|nr:porin family protein [Sulfurimonadaceae bacterium]